MLVSEANLSLSLRTLTTKIIVIIMSTQFTLMGQHSISAKRKEEHKILFAIIQRLDVNTNVHCEL